MSKDLYLLTGATGHLGYCILKQLVAENKAVRILVLPKDDISYINSLPIEIVYGDVCKKESLQEFFQNKKNYNLFLIHCAGIINISSNNKQIVHQVNFLGTQNITMYCKEVNVQQMVYVSSTHALTEKNKGQVMGEVRDFSPEKVKGLYAKSKAETSAWFIQQLDAGFPGCMVHPTGLIGPGDYKKGYFTQLIIDYLEGNLTSIVKGGYDFADIRDVAQGILSCFNNKTIGKTYILSNKYYTIKEILDKVADITGKKKIKSILPYWFARVTAPLAELYYKILKKPPLYTAYALYVLKSNGYFTHKKADEELEYTTRPMKETLEDTIKWLEEIGIQPKRKKPKT